MTEKNIKAIIKKYSIRIHVPILLFLLIAIFINYINNISASLTIVFVMVAIQVLAMLVVAFVERVLIEVFKQQDQRSHQPIDIESEQLG